MMDPYEGTQHLWSVPGHTWVTLRTKQLRAFMLETGGQIMARGRLWTVTKKSLGAGVYRVSTRPWKDSDR